MNHKLRTIGALVAGGALAVGGLLATAQPAFAAGTIVPGDVNAPILAGQPTILNNGGCIELTATLTSAPNTLVTWNVTASGVKFQWGNGGAVETRSDASGVSDNVICSVGPATGSLTVNAAFGAVASAAVNVGPYMVNVIDPSSLAISVSPDKVALANGDKQGYTATLKSNGSDIVLWDTDAPVSLDWAASLSNSAPWTYPDTSVTAPGNGSIGTLTSTGVLTADFVAAAYPTAGWAYVCAWVPGFGATNSCVTVAVGEHLVFSTNPWSLLMNPTDSGTLGVSLVGGTIAKNPANGQNILAWNSSNTNVATVAPATPGAATATVTAVGPGSANICVTVTDTNGFTITGCTPGKVTLGSNGFYASPTAAILAVGTGAQMTLLAGGPNGIPIGASWSSSDPSVAAVNPATGWVTGISAGKAQITALIPAASMASGVAQPVIYNITVVGPGNTPACSISETVFRLYNPVTGEHLWTADTNEVYVQTTTGGWIAEAAQGWQAPCTSSVPVYRLFNASQGDHLYTSDPNEVKTLLGRNVGWVMDNGGNPVFYSETTPALQQPVWRLFNTITGRHLLTTDANEVKVQTTNGSGWVSDNGGNPVMFGIIPGGTVVSQTG
jgi:uncharacterized membrane protein